MKKVLLVVLAFGFQFANAEEYLLPEGGDLGPYSTRYSVSKNLEEEKQTETFMNCSHQVNDKVLTDFYDFMISEFGEGIRQNLVQQNRTSNHPTSDSSIQVRAEIISSINQVQILNTLEEKGKLKSGDGIVKFLQSFKTSSSAKGCAVLKKRYDAVLLTKAMIQD